MLALSLLLNAVLLGLLGYRYGGRDLFVGDGVSLVLANDTVDALVEPALDYPGGSFKLPELPAGKSVGTTIQVPGEFEATLNFKDAGGSAHSRPVKIKPIGELLIVVHVLPGPAPVPAAAEDEAAEKPAAAPPGARVIVAYQGENNSI